jgi:hypothetical protein
MLESKVLQIIDVVRWRWLTELHALDVLLMEKEPLLPIT